MRRTDDRERRLHAVLAECLERLEAGETVEGADELAARYPEFASEVTQFLNDRRRLDRFVEAHWDTPGAQSVCPPVGGGDVTVAGASVSNYELLGELGRGGMAVVYRARDRRLNRVVALKMVELSTSAAARRFRLEAQLAATLDHPHIVPVYDVGEREGRPFFTMKLFEGGNLAELLAGGKWVPGTGYRRAAELVATVARAVDHAHEQGILHRDLKPANVLLDAAGRPHVADFGLARRVEIEAGLTQSGEAVGTPGYMAPEQALGRRTWSVTADVYSLGAILYELLTGRRAHRAATPLETVLRAIESDPIRPRRLDPAVPRDLETICLKCLERDAERRYPCAAALADDLGRWLACEPIAARPIGAPERLLRWGRRHPAVLWAVSAVAVVALAALWAGTLLVQSERAVGAEARGRVEAQARADLEVEHYFRTIALADRERVIGNPGRAEWLLDQCPRALRGWEWHYLRRRPLTADTPLPASSHLFCLAISPDGQMLGAGGIDGSVTLWRAGRDAPTRIADAHGGSQVRGLAFAPGGEILASAGWDGKVKLWDVETGALIREWTPGEKPGEAFAVAFSPDGRVLAAAVDDRVWRLDPATGAAVLPALRHADVVRKVAFAPRGHELAAVDDDGHLTIWDLGTNRPRLSIRAHPHRVFDVSYSRDGGRLLTAGGQFTMHGDSGEVRLWNANDGALVRAFVTNTGAFHAAALSPDGARVMAGGEDALVRVWDTRTGQEALSMRGHVEALWGLVINPDGRKVYTAGGDKNVRVWDATPVPDTEAARQVDGEHELRVTGCAFSPDGGLLVTAGMDGLARVRNADDGAVIRTLPRARGQVHALAFNPAGDRLAVAVWRRYGDDATTPDAVAVSVFDTRTWKVVARLPLKTYGVQSVAYSPDGTRLAAACDHAVVVLDTATWDVVWRAENGCLVTAVAFGRDAVACGDADGVLTLGDPRNGEALGEGVSAHQGRILGLAYSPDLDRIATASVDGTVRVWDARTRRELTATAGHRGGAFCVAFLPEGDRLVSGGVDGVLRVWDAHNGQELAAFAGHTDAVSAVAVAPDGARLASGGRDRAVRLWRLPPASRAEPNSPR